MSATIMTPKVLVITTIIGSLTYILSLAYNSLIQTTIDKYVHENNTIKAQFIYALIVTLIAAITVYYLSKYST